MSPTTLHALLLKLEDKTEAAASLASRWFEVRNRFSTDFIEQEGYEFFAAAALLGDDGGACRN